MIDEIIKENRQLSDIALICLPIFSTNIKRTVWLSVKKNDNLNLELKDLRGAMNGKIHDDEDLNHFQFQERKILL